MQHPPLLSLWTGFADLGLSLTDGNAETSTVTVSLKASPTTRSDKITAYFHQIYAHGQTTEGKSITTAKAIRGGWGYNRHLQTRLFVDLFNDYEYAAFQNLDLRFSLGGGVGSVLVKTEKIRLDLLGGGDYSHEKFSTPQTRNSSELYWGNNLICKLSKTTGLNRSFRMFNRLSETCFFPFLIKAES